MLAISLATIIIAIVIHVQLRKSDISGFSPGLVSYKRVMKWELSVTVGLMFLLALLWVTLVLRVENSGFWRYIHVVACLIFAVYSLYFFVFSRRNLVERINDKTKAEEPILTGITPINRQELPPLSTSPQSIGSFSEHSGMDNKSIPVKQIGNPFDFASSSTDFGGTSTAGNPFATVTQHEPIRQAASLDNDQLGIDTSDIDVQVRGGSFRRKDKPSLETRVSFAEDPEAGQMSTTFDEPGVNF